MTTENVGIVNVFGKLGDAIRINFFDLFANLTSPEILPEDGTYALTFTTPFPLPDGKVIKDISGTLPFSDRAEFFFLPTILTASTAPGVDAIGTTSTSANFKLTLTEVDLDVVDYLGTLSLTIDGDYSAGGVDAPQFLEHNTLDVYRQQQRLRYFGFPNELGNQITVDGGLDDDTKWAIDLFNTAAGGKTVFNPKGVSLTNNGLASGATATFTTSTTSKHGYVTGDTVTIKGASQAAYNGTFTITKVSDTQFTYTMANTVAVPTATTATGLNFSAHKWSETSLATTLTNNGAVSAAVATFTAAANHHLNTGDIVTIEGATQAAYNGTFYITKVSDTVFTYVMANTIAVATPATPASGQKLTAYEHGATFTERGRAFLNAPDAKAPRWGQIDPGLFTFASGAEQYGTTWIEEILAKVTTAPTGYPITDAQDSSGGNLKPHSTHQSGLDFDVDVPSVQDQATSTLQTIFQSHTDLRVKADGPTPDTIPVNITDGVLIRNNTTQVFYVIATSTPLPAGYTAININTMMDNKAMLSAAYDTGYLKLNTSYSRTTVKAQFDALVGGTTPSGAKVNRIWFNDPYFYDDNNYSGIVKHTQDHNGHYHVQVSPPSGVTASAINSGLQNLGNSIALPANAAPTQAGGGDLTGYGDGPAGAGLSTLSGIPFIDEELENIIDIPSIFTELASHLVTSVLLTAEAAPTTFNGSGSFMVTTNGLTSKLVTVDATGNASIGDLVADFNAAIAAAGLDSLIEADFVFDTGLGMNVLTIGTVDDGLLASLEIATTQLVTPGPGPAYGQIGSNISFDLSVTTESLDEITGLLVQETQTATVTLLAAQTTDNATLDDLALDLELAIAAAAALNGTEFLLNVIALRDEGASSGTVLDDLLVLAAADGSIIDLTISGAGAVTLGFTNPQTGEPSDNPITSDFGMGGGRAIAEFKYTDIFDLMTILEAELLDLFGSLPSGFSIDPVYDADTDTIEFNIALTKEFVKTVKLDFENGIDLGPIGTLVLSAGAEATFTADVAIQLRVGMYLGELGADVVVDETSPLADLNNGDGVLIDVGIGAANPAPANGQIGAGQVMTIKLNGGVINGGTDHTVTLSASATSTNYDPFDLADDLNAALAAAGLDTKLEAGVYSPDGTVPNRRIMINAIDGTIFDLQVIGGTLLGFSGSQSGDHVDLVILIVPTSTSYDVNLDGSQTLQDVIDAIQTQTAGAVTAYVDDITKNLVIQSVGGLELSITAGEFNNIPSIAGVGLGILGSSTSGVIIGSSLTGLSFGDSIYVVAPDPGEYNITMGIDVTASGICLEAALGILGINIMDTVPIHFEIELPIALTDPGVGDAADGRIYLSEFTANITDLVDVTGMLANMTADVTGTLELTSPILDDVLSSALATVSVSLDTPNDLSSITFEADTIDLQDALDQLKNMSIEQLLALLRNLIESLQDESDSPFMNQEIPLLGKSINDLVAYGDQLLDAIDSVVSEIDPAAVTAAKNALQTAVVNLPIDAMQKMDIDMAIDAIEGLLAGDESEMDSGLVSATRQARKRIEAKVANLLSPTPPELDMLNALADLEALIPSLETLADRLEAAVNAELPDFATFHFAFKDFDPAPGNQLALVVGLEIANTNFTPINFNPVIPTYSVGFSPELSLGVGVTTSFELNTGATFGIGLGLNLSTPSLDPFIIINPPTDPDLIRTELILTAGFDGVFSGGVQFGALDLVQADADVSLLQSIKEVGLAVIGSSVALANAPLDGDHRFIIVTDQDGDIVPITDFTVSGSALIFTGTPPTTVNVNYQTAAVPGSAIDVLNNPSQRASATINFLDPDFNFSSITNLLGAVPFSALFGGSGPDLNFETNGLLRGSVDVEVLNSVAEDAITVAASLDHLLSPQVTFDELALLDLLANVDFDLKLILQGIEAFLSLLEAGLTSEILTKLPLIGDDLNTAGTFIGDLRDRFVTPLREALCNADDTLENIRIQIRDLIWDELGPDGLDILEVTDVNFDTVIDELDIDSQIQLDTEHFEIIVILGGRDEFEVSFDSGLAGLPLKAEGGVMFGWDYHVFFGVGINRYSGFYFATDPGPDPEFSLGLDVGLIVNNDGDSPIPTSLELNLFGLKLSATDMNSGPNPGTFFAADLTLDIDGGTSNQLTPGNIADMAFGDIFQASLSATAQLNLVLEASITADLPSIAVDLCGSWTFGVYNVGSEIVVDFGVPTIGFKNIRLDFGDFLSKHLGPAIQKVNDFLEPIRPVIDLLLTEIPGVSDMSKLAGRGPVTFLDLALQLYPQGAETTRKFVNVLDQIDGVVSSIASASSGGDVILNFGDLTLGDGDGVDISSAGWNNAGNASLDTEFDNAAGLVADIAGQIFSSGNSSAGSVTNIIERQASAEGEGGLGITLEFLKPQNIFKYLVGQTADVIFWDIPFLDIVFDWSQKFPVLPVPPISVEVGLNISAFADLSIGFDTRGRDTGRFIDGFFFGDRENVTTGADIPEFGFGMGVTLAALLDLGVASAGVEGEVRADILANWRDADNNGKMYLDEMADIIEQDGILCLFDLTGEVRAIIRLVWEVLGKDGSKDIIDVLLFEFMNECPKVESAHVADGTTDGSGDGDPNSAGYNVLADGSTAASGTLIIHAGHFASLRTGSSTDTSEEYLVTELAPGVYRVEGMGIEKTYSGVSRIYFDGGVGNDKLEYGTSTITGDASVSVPVYASGGAGSDILHGGKDIDTLIGGEGGDQLYGDDGADTISGDGGDDLIYGGKGDDIITGGSGVDTIYGEDDADTIDGGSGNDYIEGGQGADIINGGANNDEIYGGPGADTIDGDAGADYIEGNAGDDILTGGSGDDIIYGMLGADTLYGESGNDLLDGGDGPDIIWAGTGNDLLIGGQGADMLFGSWGNDVILGYIIGSVGETVGEYIEGGPDDDFICGTDGIDLIYGGTSDAGLAHVQEDVQQPISAGGYTLDDCEDEPVYTPPPYASLHGQKFSDLNANGLRDADEPGLNGWTIEIYDDAGDFVASVVTMDMDLDNSGMIDPFTESGLYWFDELDPGDYTVREIQQFNWQVTTPASGEYLVELTDNQVAEHFDFGNVELASIHGTKWNDLDGDGVWDPSEQGLAGVEVYLDINGNGMQDEGEPTAITMEDDPDTAEDETGMYWIDGLLPGTYTVMETLAPGYTQTYPETTILYQTNFEQATASSHWSDTGLDITPSGRKFLGQFGDETVTLTLNTLPSHQYITAEFDLYVIGGWQGNQPAADRWRLSARDGSSDDILINTTFSNPFTLTPLAFDYNQAWPDSYPTGNYASQTGAFEVNTLGYTVGQYLTDSVYRIKVTFEHSLPNLVLDFAAMGIGGLVEASWGLDNVRITIPGDGHIVTLGPGDVAVEKDFGNTPDRGIISGVKFLDLDGSGKRDPGERGLNGWTIELLEPATMMVLRTTVTADRDINGDGMIDPITETGHYRFEGVDPGSYIIREIIQPGWTPTLPPVRSVQVAIDRPAVVDFGNRPLTGSIHGTKWRDTNRDGDRDPGEPGIAGVTIYADLNNNGRLDSTSLTFMSDGMVRNIPDFGSVNSFIEVNLPPVVITDVNVTLWIEHSFVSQLQVMLISPQGTQVVLFSNIGGSGDNFTNTTLDDEATTPISTAAAPFMGSFRPQNQLSQFDTEHPSGLWRLRVTDGGQDIAGKLLDWKLRLTVSEPSVQTMQGEPGVPDDHTGMYWMDNLPAGTYVIREVVPQGSIQTYPDPRIDGGAYIITLQPGQTVEHADFGNRPGRPGDFNYDDIVNHVDIDLLSNAINTAQNPRDFDLNDDGLVNQADKDEMIHGVLNTEYGDITLDGAVSIGDLTILAENFGRTPAGWGQGDFNGDGLVSIGDLTIMAENFGFSGGGPGGFLGDDGPEDQGQGDGLFDALESAAMAAPGSVHGTKWSDLNADGVWDAGEPGVPGVTIYADLNGNGKLDPMEPFTVTMEDDPATTANEAGMYWLDTGFGSFIIREVLPPGSTQTYPNHRLVAQEMSGRLFDVVIDTGAAVIPRDTQAQLIGISIRPSDGLLYGFALPTPAITSGVYTIDINTGAPTLVVPVPIDGGEGDIDFDPATGELYIIRANGNNLATINLTTGALTIKGAVGGVNDPSALAFDGLGRLWTIDATAGIMLRLNKNTGAILQTVPLSMNNLGTVAGMDFHPATNELYMVTGSSPLPGTQQLYKVDVITGAVTPIGLNFTDLAGLEFVSDGGHAVNVLQGAAGVENVDFGNVAPYLLLDGADEIHGHGANDTIYGDNLVSDPLVISEGDDDLILGMGGSDTLYGQDENDIIWGADPNFGSIIEGNDFIDGGVGLDEVRQTVDNNQTLTNTLLTGQGNDTLVSIERATLTGGVSNNTINASAFTAGDVFLYGLDGADTLRGGTGNDELHGGDGDDPLLQGNDGNDLIDGGNGSDVSLDGGAGNDTYFFGPSTIVETDNITDSGGIDTLDFSTLGAAEPVNVDLAIAAIASHGTRTITNSALSTFENVNGGAGNDIIRGNGSANILTGNAGNDQLFGRGNNDTLIGGAGNDTMDGGGSNDTYRFADPVGVETDIVNNASGGVDTLDFSLVSGSTPVTVNLTSVTIATHVGRTVTTSAPTGFQNVIGTSGDDVITDNDLTNVLTGGGGDDTYIFIQATVAQTDTVVETASGGVDHLDFGATTSAVLLNLTMNPNIGANGLRTLNGNGPNLENVTGGSAADTITGNDSDNILIGRQGADTLNGGDGNDRLDGGQGSDALNGGDGDDTYAFGIVLAAETDTVTENPGVPGGRDTLDFSALSALFPVTVNLAAAGIASHGLRTIVTPNPSLFENATGGAGNDTLIGNSSNNILIGNDGNDVMNGADGDDRLLGGRGDDRYIFASTALGQADEIDEQPGEGFDTLDFSLLAATDGVTVDLTAATIFSHTNRTATMAAGAGAYNLEKIIGGAGDDDITGSDADNIIEGGAGNDTLRGGKGNDSLTGGAGINKLEGGSGDDTYIFLNGVAATDTLVEITGYVLLGIASNGGTDTLDFSAFTAAVTVNLNLTSQTVAGLLNLNFNDDLGPATTHFEDIIGSASAVNILTGNAGKNRLTGGAVGDTLNGGDGDDVLIGLGGDDTLRGGNDNDILLGGDGADILDESPSTTGRNILIGGDGADTLTGDADQDILIGAYYDADANLPVVTDAEIAGLQAILFEWTSAILPFATRVANIHTGVGIGGLFKLLALTTVFDDADNDILTGGSGLDWFFIKMPGDTITDFLGTEQKDLL